MTSTRKWLCAIAVVCCLACTALAVDVPVGKDGKNSAGIGFGLLSGNPQDLTVNFNVTHANDGWRIQKSKTFDRSGRAIWTPAKIDTAGVTHTYTAAGVKPNDGHAAKFDGEIAKTGGQGQGQGQGQGGGDPLTFWAGVCDIDVDADTDNDSAQQYRPPSENDVEDACEEAGADSNPSAVPGVNLLAGDVVAVKIKINPKKEGSYTVSNGNKVTLWDNDACTTEATWPKTANASIYMKAGTTLGSDTLTATFTPTGGEAENVGTSVDKLTANVQDIVIIFSKSEVRPGSSGATRAETVTVTARRGAGGAAVTIDLSCSHARATVAPASFQIAADQTEGSTQATVTGNQASPANRDTQLLGKVGANTKGSLPVTVTFPRNWWSSGITTPPLSDNTPAVAQWQNQWYVEWGFDLTLTAQDQFGEILRPQWQGAIMQESEDGQRWVGFTLPNGDPLNQNAQVTDPVRATTGPYANQAAAQAAMQQILQNPISFDLGVVTITLRVVDGGTNHDLMMRHRRVKALVNNVFSQTESKVP